MILSIGLNKKVLWRLFIGYYKIGWFNRHKYQWVYHHSNQESFLVRIVAYWASMKSKKKPPGKLIRCLFFALGYLAKYMPQILVNCAFLHRPDVTKQLHYLPANKICSYFRLIRPVIEFYTGEMHFSCHDWCEMLAEYLAF